MNDITRLKTFHAIIIVNSRRCKGDGKYAVLSNESENDFVFAKNMKNAATGNQMSLFSPPREQGHREWNTFNAVKHDKVGMFRVLTPRKHETPHYPNIVHINRYPRHITPTFAR